MSESNVISRRQLLRRSVALACAAAGATAFVAACKNAPKELTCDDTNGLAQVDVQTRKALEYADRSPDPKKLCDNCLQYIEPPTAGKCGGCKMFKGDVSPKGYCKVWQDKAAAPA